MSDTTQDFTHMSDEAFEALLESGSPMPTTDVVTDANPAPELTEAQEETSIGEDTQSLEHPQHVQDPHTPISEDSGEVVESDFTPIKVQVGGTEIEVRTEEEHRQLLQRGLESAQNPSSRQTVKTLEANKIEQADLNLLIDAHKGDKRAIAQLLKKHEIDSFDLDVDSEDTEKYVPTDHTVTNTQMQLEDVISRIESTESFNRTSKVVSQEWDTASKQQIFGTPQLLETLNTHVANGTYDMVMSEVNRAKVFGGLSGMSDLEAYQKVGMEMQKNNAFANAPKNPTVSTAPKQNVGKNKQRRAAGMQRGTAKAAPATPVDFSSMSDDDFEKLLNGGK